MSEKIKKKRTWLWVVAIIILVMFGILAGSAILGILFYYSYNSKLSTQESYPSYDYGEGIAYEPSSEAELKRSDESFSYEIESVETAAGELAEKKVIKTGSLKLVVDDVSKSVDQITSLANNKDGFVQSSNVDTDPEGAQTAYIIIKIPADRFEETIEEAKNLSLVVENENISGKDVTEEYMDLQAQLKNYRAEEEQYLEIMEKADTVEDILKVSEKLSLIRGKIERTEGRIKYLESQTDYSTITIYLSQEVKVEVPTKKWRPLTNLKTAFQYWVKALQGILDVLVWIIIFIGPPIIIIWLIIASIRKKRKKK